MLVFAKNPRGVIYLDQYRIYGKETGHKPCDLPFEVYSKYKDAVQDAPYREGFLKEKFGGDFPPIAFTYSEIRYLPVRTLKELAKQMNIKVRRHWTRISFILVVKKAIRRISPDVVTPA